MKDFQGCVAVVTGAASGIGLATTERFLLEGMKVVMADVEKGSLDREVARLAAAGGEVLGVVCDVRDPEAVVELKDRTLERFRGVHVVFNNAGVGPAGPMLDTKPADWRWIVDVNVLGVAYGVMDYQRLMETMTMRDGHIALEEGGVHAAESLLVSRLLMYPTVYFHHVSRIAQKMLDVGVRVMVEEGADPRKIRDMDDTELVAAMISSGGYPGEIIGRIRSRHLFKRAVYVGRDRLESPGMIDRGREGRIAEEIAEVAGIEPLYVLVDKPELPRIAEGNMAIIGEDGEKKPLREVSPLVTIMESAHFAAWRLGVYTTEENRERVKKAAMRHLKVRRNPVQHTFEDI